MTEAAASPSHFDDLFRRDADPWRTRTRWYEARKRALTLAALACERHERAFEPGCGAGELTAALARRCAEVVASDASAAAVRLARARLASTPNVRIEQARMPADWPAGRFDLVVVSELGYYLEPGELRKMAGACRSSLAGGGTLVACHWRHPADDMKQGAQAVHAALGEGCGLQALSHYEDADFLLDVWTSDARSVAQREGLA